MSKRIKFYSLTTGYHQKVYCRVALNKYAKLTCYLYSSNLFTTVKLSVTLKNCPLNIQTALSTESCLRFPRHEVTNSNATPP